MSEPTTNPTDTQPTMAAADLPAAPTYRVSGHLPLTISVTAASADDATRATCDAVAAVFAGRSDVTLTPDLHAIGSPQLVEHPTGADQPGRYRIEVTVYGYLDVAADDPADAIVVAEETLLDHLAGRSEVTTDWTFAVCDDVTPLASTE